jgi:AcrR family transcriptional regulator
VIKGLKTRFCQTCIAPDAKTKERIIEIAAELFAKKGFDAVSVREIAREAEVNLGAINYHFQSKQSLYAQILLTSRAKLEADIKSLFEEKTRSTEDFVIAMLDMLIADGKNVLNIFKVFLSYTTNDPKDLVSQHFLTVPGMDHLTTCIEQDVKQTLSAEDKDWGVKMIFSSMIHHAVILSTETGKGFYSIDQRSYYMRRLVQAIVNDLSK